MEKQQKNNSNNQEIDTDAEEQLLNEVENQPSDTLMLQDSLQEIVSLKNQIEILQDKLLRTIAESDNTRKRLEKSIEEAKDYAIVSFAKDLLSVNDNLSRALEHKPQNMEGDLANIITGVEMTKSELTSILQKHGLESIEPLLGEKFDYNIHHAISQIVSEEYDQDSVIAVMQSGYKIKDRLLRPAIVQVSKNG
ncbi:MAG: nucleotide exchange factor GrpE [Rickettsia endosymbiont of Culicoides impunctatus]|uniref:nucleotide exchange factor GrpE n=1 Tax=Candidatus Tisiphia endosymbiont of Dioctria linearis TaxID=3066254 RepID=UPI001E748C81|nr:nucleotide exchange factor GrpE [Rickettsia endosymbiont of Platyusa sonomae]UCM86023.1 MAG: nucleotide exchange factor GrpE [Rickettsia endosymbiont of Culicoides impunctatus]